MSSVFSYTEILESAKEVVLKRLELSMGGAAGRLPRVTSIPEEKTVEIAGDPKQISILLLDLFVKKVPCMKRGPRILVMYEDDFLLLFAK